MATKNKHFDITNGAFRLIGQWGSNGELKSGDLRYRGKPVVVFRSNMDKFTNYDALLLLDLTGYNMQLLGLNFLTEDTPVSQRNLATNIISLVRALNENADGRFIYIHTLEILEVNSEQISLKLISGHHTLCAVRNSRVSPSRCGFTKRDMRRQATLLSQYSTIISKMVGGGRQFHDFKSRA